MLQPTNATQLKILSALPFKRSYFQQFINSAGKILLLAEIWYKTQAFIQDALLLYEMWKLVNMVIFQLQKWNRRKICFVRKCITGVNSALAEGWLLVQIFSKSNVYGYNKQNQFFSDAVLELMKYKLKCQNQILLTCTESREFGPLSANSN